MRVPIGESGGRSGGRGGVGPLLAALAGGSGLGPVCAQQAHGRRAGRAPLLLTRLTATNGNSVPPPALAPVLALSRTLPADVNCLKVPDSLTDDQVRRWAGNSSSWAAAAAAGWQPQQLGGSSGSWGIQCSSSARCEPATCAAPAGARMNLRRIHLALCDEPHVGQDPPPLPPGGAAVGHPAHRVARVRAGGGARGRRRRDLGRGARWAGAGWRRGGGDSPGESGTRACMHEGGVVRSGVRGQVREGWGEV